MSYDKRDYKIDGRRDFSDHSSDDDQGDVSFGGPQTSSAPQWWVAKLLVDMKVYCESNGVDLLTECKVDDLAHFLSTHKSRRVYA